MRYIVEIRNKQGSVAQKEFEGRTIREAYRQAELELSAYPGLMVNDVWEKGSTQRGLFGTRPSEA
ncbi:MAG: hypothetical protein AB7F35_26720 [Acetobacteraceae bacterium]